MDRRRISRVNSNVHVELVWRRLLWVYLRGGLPAQLASFCAGRNTGLGLAPFFNPLPMSLGV